MFFIHAEISKEGRWENTPACRRLNMTFAESMTVQAERQPDGTLAKEGGKISHYARFDFGEPARVTAQTLRRLADLIEAQGAK